MSPPPIKLTMLSDALDADGQPRCGLLMPPPASTPGRRPVLVIFSSLTAALDVKRSMEAGH